MSWSFWRRKKKKKPHDCLTPPPPPVEDAHISGPALRYWDELDAELQEITLAEVFDVPAVPGGRVLGHSEVRKAMLYAMEEMKKKLDTQAALEEAAGESG